MNHSPTVYQVSDLTNEMRRLMETSYPEIWIEGELSSLSTPASGHLYFSLKDAQSQLRCAMFKGRASVNRYRPKAGDLVRVRAKISVYPARGDLQCIVQYIEEAGEGVLQRRYEELKHALHQQGLFDQAHKQSIPSYPKHIGIITSPSGAAINDILSTLKRRCPGIPVTIYPAVVQGETAVPSLLQALADAVQHQRCDVLILSRGGGSLEDLWCFNDEQLARAIYQCPIPIVSGVGHEVDVTIADLSADLRAPTPTAAAELLSPDNSQLLAQLQTLQFRLPRSMERYLQRLAQATDISGRQLVHPKQQLNTKRTQLQQLSLRARRAMQNAQQTRHYRLSQQMYRLPSPQSAVKQQQQQVYALAARLKLSKEHTLERSQQRFNALGEQLNLVSPLATLERGFAIARDDQKSIIRKTSQVKKEANISVQLSDGHLQCTVIESQ